MSYKKKHTSIFTGPIERLTQKSYGQLFSLWLSLAAIYGVAYFLLALFLPNHGPSQLVDDPTLLQMLLDALYYSVITATSTGYGDITPQGFSKFLAGLQSITALMVFAVFVTKLVSHKQEVALREVHKLTFEDVFHNIREGLFIIRKDFDHLMHDAETHAEFSDEHWMDLVIAFRQGQSLLEEIPDFYAAEDGLYTIDLQREELLHEAVHRTLHRINQMLNVFSMNGVEWVTHEDVMSEIHKFLKTLDTVTPLWEKESPYREAFEDILTLTKNIHTKIKDASEQ